jgi:hypothetical protein
LEPQVPLETATYVSDLVTSNPAASDPLANADDHLRLVKATLKATLAHTGQLTNTDNQLIPAAGTSTKPAYSFAAEPTLGLYRSATGVMSVAGGKLKGTRDPGEVATWLKEPASLGKATSDTGKDWLELNGATYNRTDYPALADFMNGVGVGTTFTLPDMYTLGRFPRSRTAATAALTAQANTVGPHTHPDVTPTTAAETQEHTHGFSGTTGNDSPDHTHGYTRRGGVIHQDGTQGATVATQDVADTTAGASTRHQHGFSGTTAGRSATHNHTVTVSTPANTGTTETRPEALSFVFAVKT